jgi:hypothetical protein
MFSNFFFENRAVCEIIWKNIAERGRPQMTIWRMRLHIGYPRLQTHTQNVYDLLIFHGNNGCTNAPQYYLYSFIARLVVN